MKALNFTLLFLLGIFNTTYAQRINVSDKLFLTKLTDRTYIHTCQNNNGLIFINEGKALIVSTPDSDSETQNLIDWVIEEQKAKIVGYVIDRWHPDAMEGLDIVHKNGIKSYSYELTRQIANEKGLPIPQIGFDPKTEIQIGNEKIICHFLGEAHTKDGIVVWIPSEKILFGGNEIRNYNGWVGNIGDANLQEWSNTATKIKEHYGTAKIVVPGHGKHGGSELIDYTIKLYDLPQKVSNKGTKGNKKRTNPLNDKEISIEAELDTISNDKRILTNAKITIQDNAKLIIIESPKIELQENKLRIDSKTGRVKIYDKKDEFINLRIDVSFNKLIVLNYDETVGFVVILKEITTANNVYK